MLKIKKVGLTSPVVSAPQETGQSFEAILETPHVSGRIKLASRLTSNYMVEKRQFLNTKRYVLKFVTPPCNEKIIKKEPHKSSPLHLNSCDMAFESRSPAGHYQNFKSAGRDDQYTTPPPISQPRKTKHTTMQLFQSDILGAENPQTDKIEIRKIKDVRISEISAEEFTLITNEEITLHCSERSRLLTELQIFREIEASEMSNIQNKKNYEDQIFLFHKQIRGGRARYQSDLYSKDCEVNAQKVADVHVTTFGVCAKSRAVKNQLAASNFENMSHISEQMNSTDQDNVLSCQSPKQQQQEQQCTSMVMSPTHKSTRGFFLQLSPKKTENTLHTKELDSSSFMTDLQDEKTLQTCAWIFFCDIDKIIQQDDKTLYIVKRNKEVVKFIFEEEKQINAEVSTVGKNSVEIKKQMNAQAVRRTMVCNSQKFIGRHGRSGIVELDNQEVKKKVQIMRDAQLKQLKLGQLQPKMAMKNPTQDAQIVDQFVWSFFTKQTRVTQLFSCQGQLFTPNYQIEEDQYESREEIKTPIDIELELTQTELYIFHSYTLKEENTKDLEIVKRILFKQHLGNLQQVTVVVGQSQDDIPEENSLLLTFYIHEANSFRDIELKLGSKKGTKQEELLIELLTQMAHLRELIVKYGDSHSEQAGSFNFFKMPLTIQVLEEKPAFHQLVMGINLNGQVRDGVDAEFESALFKRLIDLLDSHKEIVNAAVNASSDQPVSMAHMQTTVHVNHARYSSFFSENRQQIRSNPLDEKDQLNEGHNSHRELQHKVLQSLECINLNCSFYQQNRLGDRSKQLFALAIIETANRYWEQLAQQEVDPDVHKNSFEFHVSELDTDSEDEKDKNVGIGNLQTSLKQEEEEYRKTLHNRSNQSMNQSDFSASQDSQSSDEPCLLADSISSVSQDDGVKSQTRTKKAKIKDKYRHFQQTSDLLVQLLVCLKKLLQSAYVFREFLDPGRTYLRVFVRTLLKLLKVDNSFVCYLAGQCVRAFLNFEDEGEQQAEAKNKEKLLSFAHEPPKIDMLKYVFRLLKYHDRYQSVGTQERAVKCQLQLKVISDLLGALICDDRPSLVGLNPLNRDIQRNVAARLFLKCLEDEDCSSEHAKLIYSGSFSKSTRPEDLFQVVSALFRDNFKQLHALDRLSYSNQYYLSLTYGRILYDVLLFCESHHYKHQFSKGRQAQSKGLLNFGSYELIRFRYFVYTCQLPFTIIVMLKERTALPAQRHLAFRLFCRLMHRNKNACLLIGGMFKRFLLKDERLVEEGQDRREIQQWDDKQWFDFFQRVKTKNEIKGIDQHWSQNMREFLLNEIQLQLSAFNQVQKANLHIVFNQSSKQTNLQLTLPSHVTHFYDMKGGLHASCENLQWSFRQFRVNYTQQEEKLCKVWKYYLQRLFIEGVARTTELPEGQSPRLSDQLTDNIYQFWQRLEMQFISEKLDEKQQRFQMETVLSSSVTDEKRLKELMAEIEKSEEKRLLQIKCLILLYRTHISEIGELKTLPFWLRQLENPTCPKYFHTRSNQEPNFIRWDNARKITFVRYHFLILQLCFCAINAQNAPHIVSANMRLFERSKGLETVIASLHLGLTDLGSSKRYLDSKTDRIEIDTYSNESLTQPNYSEHGQIPVEPASSESILEQISLINKPPPATTADLTSRSPDNDLAYFNEKSNFEAGERSHLVLNIEPINVDKTFQSHQQLDFNHDTVDLKIGSKTASEISHKNERVEIEEGIDMKQVLVHLPELVPTPEELSSLFNYAGEIIGDHLFFEGQTVNSAITVLAMRILDFLMNQRKNRHCNPISVGKKFILQKHNARLLASLLVLGNAHISHSVLNFITNHLNSPFALYSFRDTQIVELLILHLDLDFSKYEGEEIINDGKLYQQVDEVCELSLTLLKALQNVFHDYNETFKVANNFDSDDQKALNRSPYLKDSIMLRYLPLPFVKLYLSDDDQLYHGGFMQIFRSKDRHETPSLIWDRPMREELKNTLWQHQVQLMRRLNDFCVQQKHVDLTLRTESLPKHIQCQKHKIKYPQIEEDVLCYSDKYYLGVWVQCGEDIIKEITFQLAGKRFKNEQTDENQPQYFEIPRSEEEEFLLNAQEMFNETLSTFRELSTNGSTIFQQQYSQLLQKLIIMLKTCILTSKQFATKSFICLDQVHQLLTILLTIDSDASSNLVYDSELQHILNLAIQSLFVSINFQKNRNQEKEMGIKQMKQNQLKMQSAGTFKILQKVIGLVLRRAGKRPKIDRMSSDPGIKLKRIECEILIFSIMILRILTNSSKDKAEWLLKSETQEDITSIFGMLVDLFDIPFQFYKAILPPRQEKFVRDDDDSKYEQSVISGTSTNSKAVTIFNQFDKDQNRKRQRTQSFTQVHGNNFVGLRLRKRPSAEKVIAITNSLNMGAQTARNSPVKKRNSSSMSQDNRMQSNSQKDKLSLCKNSMIASSRNFRKLKFGHATKAFVPILMDLDDQRTQHDYEENNFDITLDPDEFKALIESEQPSKGVHGKPEQEKTRSKIQYMLNLASAILKFGLSACELVPTHREMLRSCFIWRVLQFMFFNESTAFTKSFQGCIPLLNDSVHILIYVVSFAQKYQQKAVLQQKNACVDKVTNQHFWNAIQKLLPKKILEKLYVPFDLIEIGPLHQITLQGKTKEQIEKFRDSFVQEERLPELVWNKKMRKELFNILRRQIKEGQLFRDKTLWEFCPKQWKNSIYEFQYKIYSQELVVCEIFLKHLISNKYSRLPHMQKFIEELFAKLQIDMKKIISRKQIEFDTQLRRVNTTDQKALLHLNQSGDSKNGERSEMEKYNDKIKADVKLMLRTLLHSIHYLNLLKEKIDWTKEKISILCECAAPEMGDKPLSEEKETIRYLALEILNQISQNSRIAEQVYSNQSFILLVLRSLGQMLGQTIEAQSPNEILIQSQFQIELKKLLEILQNYMNKDKFAFVHLLTDHGVLLFLCRALLETAVPKEIREPIVQLFFAVQKHVRKQARELIPFLDKLLVLRLGKKILDEVDVIIEAHNSEVVDLKKELVLRSMELIIQANI